jgi:hypothetical protein
MCSVSGVRALALAVAALAGLSGLATFLPRAAYAQDGAKKGPGPHAEDAGNIAFGGNLELGASKLFDGTWNVDGGVGFHPAIDVTVARSLSLGTAVHLSYGWSHDSKGAASYGIAPRMGYIVALGEHVLLWPRVGLGLYKGNTEDSASTFHHTVFAFSARLPLHFQPVRHLLLGVGPVLMAQLSNRVDDRRPARTVTLGIEPEFVGWF